MRHLDPCCQAMTSEFPASSCVAGWQHDAWNCFRAAGAISRGLDVCQSLLPRFCFITWRALTCSFKMCVPSTLVCTEFAMILKRGPRKEHCTAEVVGMYIPAGIPQYRRPNSFVLPCKLNSRTNGHLAQQPKILYFGLAVKQGWFPGSKGASCGAWM